MRTCDKHFKDFQRVETTEVKTRVFMCQQIKGPFEYSGMFILKIEILNTPPPFIIPLRVNLAWLEKIRVK